MFRNLYLLFRVDGETLAFFRNFRRVFFLCFFRQDSTCCLSRASRSRSTSSSGGSSTPYLLREVDHIRALLSMWSTFTVQLYIRVPRGPDQDEQITNRTRSLRPDAALPSSLHTVLYWYSTAVRTVQQCNLLVLCCTSVQRECFGFVHHRRYGGIVRSIIT